MTNIPSDEQKWPRNTKKPLPQRNKLSSPHNRQDTHEDVGRLKTWGATTQPLLNSPGVSVSSGVSVSRDPTQTLGRIPNSSCVNFSWSATATRSQAYGLRLLNMSVVFVFSITKAILAYMGQSAIPTTLDWVSGAFLAVW